MVRRVIGVGGSSCGVLSGLTGVDDGAGDHGCSLFQACQRHVVLLLDPVVMFFGEDCANQADHGVTVGEDPDDICAPAGFTVEPFGGVIRPHFGPHDFWRVGKREQVVE